MRHSIEFVTGFLGLLALLALFLYAPALMATEFWADSCGFGVFNNWFEVGYYLQTACE